MPLIISNLGIPLLFIAQATFLLVTARRVGGTVSIVVLLTALGTWGAISALLALNGVYRSAEFLDTNPGFWLPATPFAIVIILCALGPIRRALIIVATHTPQRWFIAIQALRIAALGTLLRTTKGGFPLHVELSIGLTDLAFGLSAALLLWITSRRNLSEDALIIWHLVGVLIIILPGEWAIQAGLPGPLGAYDYTGIHSSAPMLEYPMVLAPSFVVPIFLILNLLGAYGAWQRSKTQKLKNSLQRRCCDDSQDSRSGCHRTNR